MRKLFTSTILLIALTLTATIAQNSPVAIESNPEFPEFSKETLRIDDRVELYPNPTTDFLNVTIRATKLENVEFELYNIIGNSLRINIEQVSSQKYKINVKDFNSGYYLLVIKDPITRFNQVFKFQKQ